MTNKNNKPKESGQGALRECDVNRLIVEPLANQIREQGIWGLEQSNEILNKLEKLEELVSVIARQIYRELEGNTPEDFGSDSPDAI